jgi:16S rRNA (cytosine1402-N4)-methyltransferase
MAQKKQQKKKITPVKKAKKVVAKKVVMKKKVVKKVVKKSAAKKVSKKVVKKSAPKKAASLKKGGFRKAVKKLLKKVTKKVVAKKTSKKPVKKVAKKVAPKKVMKKVKAVKKMKPAKKVVKAVAKKQPKGKKLNVAKADKKAVAPKETKVKVTAEAKVEETEDASVGPQHVSVLLNEIVEMLQPEKRRVIVDGTLGLGGHAKVLLSKMPAAGKYIGFDLDNDHIAIAQKRLKDFSEQLVVVHDNFSTLADKLKEMKLKGADAILLDLGMASPHVDNPEKGFSFLHDGPLDMRFNKDAPYTAADVVNSYSEKELLRIFREYGEEHKARKIAHEISLVRKNHPFKTTKQLADFIEKHVKRMGHIHPATRVFQALRIEVNKELDSLVNVLRAAVEVLRPGGRIAVISYHSLEDRIVKHFFKDQTRDYVNVPGEIKTTKLDPTLDILTKKPIVPTDAEVLQNPRSRSAKLRVAQRLKVKAE